NVSHRFNSYGNGTGTFVVTLTDTGAGGCTNSSSQTVSVVQGPGAILLPGSGVDTVTFNGYMTLYKCASAAQQTSNFTFLNGAIPASGITYTILWGDTGAPFSSSSNWITISHIYTRG